MSDVDELVAEGQIMEDEQHIDDMVAVADSMLARGKTKEDIKDKLLAKRPSHYHGSWEHLVKSALEYIDD